MIIDWVMKVKNEMIHKIKTTTKKMIKHKNKIEIIKIKIKIHMSGKLQKKIIMICTKKLQKFITNIKIIKESINYANINWIIWKKMLNKFKKVKKK